MAECDLQPPPAGEVVRRLVQAIPPGRVATYGTVGRAAATQGSPIGGARTVAWILASLKGRDDTPWHRVVGAGGRILLPDERGALQRRRLRGEGVTFQGVVIDPSCLLGVSELRPNRRHRR